MDNTKKIAGVFGIFWIICTIVAFGLMLLPDSNPEFVSSYTSVFKLSLLGMVVGFILMILVGSQD